MPDIPSFLHLSNEPRELADVQPPLRFACTEAEWHYVNDIVEDVWYEVRFRRASAWDGSFSDVIKAEYQIERFANELVEMLTRCDVHEEAVRDWLVTFRHKTDQAEREQYDQG